MTERWRVIKSLNPLMVAAAMSSRGQEWSYQSEQKNWCYRGYTTRIRSRSIGWNLMYRVETWGLWTEETTMNLYRSDDEAWEDSPGAAQGGPCCWCWVEKEKEGKIRKRREYINHRSKYINSINATADQWGQGSADQCTTMGSATPVGGYRERKGRGREQDTTQEGEERREGRRRSHKSPRWQNLSVDCFCSPASELRSK